MDWRCRERFLVFNWYLIRFRQFHRCISSNGPGEFCHKLATYEAQNGFVALGVAMWPAGESPYTGNEQMSALSDLQKNRFLRGMITNPLN